jgi:glucan phosphoethanolaminetransferase (alkaline phosphatase superfamily)
MPSRAAALAGGMTLFLLFFELLVFHPPYGEYFPDVFNRGPLWGALRLAALVGLIGLQFLYFWASFTVSTGWRVVYGVLFGLVVLVQYGYAHATGGFVSGHDFDVAAAEMPHWLPMIRLYVTGAAVIPIAVYAALLVLAPRSTPRSGVTLLAVLMVLAFAVHSTYAFSLHRLGDEDVGLSYGSGPPLLSPLAFGRAGTMWVWSRAAGHFWHTRFGGRAQVPAHPSHRPSRHILLVVDESVRADHLSVNGYGRATTPWLDAQARRGALLNWGFASSTFPLSNDSVLTLLTGVYRVPDRERHAQTQPTIFQFAKSMNYRTHLFDGGANGLRWGFDDDDLRFIDNWGTHKQFGNDPETDFRIATEVSRVLEASDAQFIVVLKRGNHKPYRQNYRAEQSMWRPDDFHSSSTDDPNTVYVNDYDNAIRYNVDGFFQALERGGRLDRVSVIYTADHGQLLTDGRDEGLSRNLYWGDVVVPMIMLGHLPQAIDTEYRASHANVVPTLLDLMQVPPEARSGAYGRSLFTGTRTTVDQRWVFSGDLFGVGPFTRQDFDTLARPPARP